MSTTTSLLDRYYYTIPCVFFVSGENKLIIYIFYLFVCLLWSLLTLLLQNLLENCMSVISADSVTVTRKLLDILSLCSTDFSSSDLHTENKARRRRFVFCKEFVLSRRKRKCKD